MLVRFGVTFLRILGSLFTFLFGIKRVGVCTIQKRTRLEIKDGWRSFSSIQGIADFVINWIRAINPMPFYSMEKTRTELERIYKCERDGNMILKQKAKSKRQKAKGKRQKAKSKKQKAKSKRIAIRRRRRSKEQSFGTSRVRN